MTNAIITLALIIILTAAITYIVKKKKSGVKCIGCPYSANCTQSHSKESSCNCGYGENNI